MQIAARGVAREELQRLVEQSYCCSPMSAALRDVVPVSLAIGVDGE